MTNKKPIAILGGMGPEASLKLYELLIQKAREVYHAKNNEDYPEIIINSIPVPDFISNETQKEIAKQMLIKKIQTLNKMPIGNFCIACNTVHILLPELQKETIIPFVSIIDEVIKQVNSQQLKSIGLLGSPTMINSQLYQNELYKTGIQVITPTKEEIESLGKIISEIVGGNYKNTKTIIKITDNLKREGANGIILGCTELPLVFPKKYSLPFFNSLDILANALLKKYYNTNNQTD
jgi:aspartate racemase